MEETGHIKQRAARAAPVQDSVSLSDYYFYAAILFLDDQNERQMREVDLQSIMKMRG